MKKTINHSRYQPSNPVEWLQFFANELLGLADLWDEYEPDYFEEDYEYYKVEEPDTTKLDMYADISHGISERLLHDYRYISGDIIRDIESYKEKILDEFENSGIFLTLIDSMAILESMINDAKSTEKNFYYWQYYSICSTKEEAGEHFGKLAPQRFDRKRKLTTDDYEASFECITRLLEKVKEERYSARLRESAWRLKSYCKLSISRADYEKIEKEIEEKKKQAIKKRGRNVLEKQVADLLKRLKWPVDITPSEIKEILDIENCKKYKPTNVRAIRDTEAWKALQERKASSEIEG